MSRRATLAWGWTTIGMMQDSSAFPTPTPRSRRETGYPLGVDNGILKWNARYISFGCRPGGREGIMRGWCVSDRIYGRGNSIFFRGRGCIVTRVCRRRFFIEWVYRCGIGQWEFVWIWTSMVGVFERESIGNGWIDLLERSNVWIFILIIYIYKLLIEILIVHQNLKIFLPILEI